MENTQNTGAPSTPNLSASVNATKLSNPATVGDALESPPNMESGESASTQSSSNGIDLAQWITIGLVALTVVSLITQIVVNRRSLVKLNEEDKQLREDVTELKLEFKNFKESQTSTRRAA